VRALVVAGLLLVSCGELSSGALAGATASTGATRGAGSSATRSHAPTFSPTPSAVPIGLGTDPAVGLLAGGCLGTWAYDGRTGALAMMPTPSPASSTTGTRSSSPNGRYATEIRRVTAGPIIERTDLWLIDTATGTERLLYSPPAPPSQGQGATAQPNPNIPPYVFQRTEYVGPWSPDERYLAMWIVDAVGNSIDADGRPLAIVDVATGALTELGRTLLGSTLAWRAPHTLAYVAGLGREHWSNKMLRIWTPETGSRDLTVPGEIGIKPAWGPDGRLWFVNGPSGDYDVPTYFAGRGIGDHSVLALELDTGRRVMLPRVPGYADEGVRVSRDGTVALVLRRRLDPIAQAKGLGTRDDALELWSQRPDGASPRPLVRLCTSCGFGYYGGYASLASLDWNR